MKSLFVPADREEILDRLDALRAGAERRWGKMDAAQMLAHCTATLEVGAGEKVKTQRLLGKLLAPFVKSKVLGGQPMMRNAPTDPEFVMADPRDFAREKARLAALLVRFSDAGPAAADGRIHSFFGRLEGAEWGVLMYKHLDHHLRQFGA